MDRPSMLGRLAFFGKLAPAELERILQHCEERSYVDGQRILDEGVRGTGLFVLIEGRAEVEKGLQGNICRCCTYPRIVAAVRMAAAASKGVAR